jgi:hypothetical protein
MRLVDQHALVLANNSSYLVVPQLSVVVPMRTIEHPIQVAILSLVLRAIKGQLDLVGIHYCWERAQIALLLYRG